MCWLDCYFIRNNRTQITSVASLSTKNYQINQTKLPSSARVTSWLARFSQFEEYLQKQGKIQIRSWTLILDTRAEVCKYITVYLHFIQSLKCHICYTDYSFPFYAYLYFWLLGPWDKAIGLIWVAAQKAEKQWFTGFHTSVPAVYCLNLSTENRTFN